MRDTSLAGQRVLVFGLGLHGGGAGTVRWLVRQKARVTVTDLKTAAKLRPTLTTLRGLPIRYVLGRHRLFDVRHADLIVQNPGARSTRREIVAARALGVPIVNIAWLFFRAEQRPIVGVTGTRGKSTTATMIATLLNAKRLHPVLVGTPGHSLLDASEEPDARVVVAELSSWQLEGLDRRCRGPRVAVVTNLYRDHLNRYASFRSYAAAKRRVLRFQKPGDVAVLPADQMTFRTWARSSVAHVLWFSLGPRLPGDGVAVRQNWFVERRAGRWHRLARVSDLPLAGQHNVANAAAALAACLPFGLSAKSARTGLRQLRALPGRQEQVATVRQRRYINDTTATSPDGVLAALQTFRERPLTLVAGGSDKRLDFRQLARQLPRTVDEVVLLPGDASRRLRALLPTKWRERHVRRAATMHEAVAAATKLTPPGGTILLSPGAASFASFTNEYERGDAFVAAVRAQRYGE